MLGCAVKKVCREEESPSLWLQKHPTRAYGACKGKAFPLHPLLFVAAIRATTRSIAVLTPQHRTQHTREMLYTGECRARRTPMMMKWPSGV